ncbi:MAG TPA: hypothetical protein VFC74_00080 [Oscillospiraceae bacterium]|nr:hypothetical protein [Oscillospiraceae bacterium]
MRGKALLILLSMLLVLTGCAAPFSEVQVAEEIAACYQLLSPTVVTINLLATLPHHGNLLVLVADHSAAEAPLMDLFLLNTKGVVSLASAPLTNKIKLHSLVDGNETLLYGPLPTAAEDGIPVENLPDAIDTLQTITGKAAITLNSWKIIEQQLPIAKGFILALKQKRQAEAVNLYDETGKILAQFAKLSKGAMKETSFTAWDELPLPRELEQENMAAVQVAASVLAAEDEGVSLAEEEVREPLIAAFNACLPELRRKGSEAADTNLVVTIHLNDGSSVLIKQHNSNFTISFERAEVTLNYEASSSELAALFKTYSKLLKL